MTQEIRGGNSRQLAKTLDQLQNPTAILDRRGVIVYVNAALCSMAQADATQLVGKQCSWQLAADETEFAAILTALAPPAGALQGRISARRLTAPIVFGSTATGQLFVPLLDADQLVHATLVTLGTWEEIQGQVPSDLPQEAFRRRRGDQTLVTMRSKWKSLDGLVPLIGDSPAIQMAMARAQLAVSSDCNFLISGDVDVGKAEVARGIFLGRRKRHADVASAGSLFPIDCNVLDGDLFAGMLEVFAGRLRTAQPHHAQQLLLEHVDQLPSASVAILLKWIRDHDGACTLSATSQVSVEQLLARGAEWMQLVTKLAVMEVHIPPLKDRREDIIPLAQHAMALYCQRHERAQLLFSSEALDLLTSFPWPGNLKQLVQAIEESIKHAVLSAAIQANHLPVAIRAFPGSVRHPRSETVEPIELDAVLLELERILLQRALRLSPRNRAQAARLLGISRPRLLRRIAQLGLDGPPDDAEETPS